MSRRRFAVSNLITGQLQWSEKLAEYHRRFRVHLAFLA